MINAILDQAASLRARFRGGAPAPSQLVPLVAVASGKGGVGKTFLAVNLSMALAEQQQRPLLVDLDWGLANVDVALGLAPHRHMGHVLRGECTLEDVLLTHGDLLLAPNGCGEGPPAGNNADREAALLAQARSPHLRQDITVADTHPGLGERTLSVLRAATLTLLVTTPDPTSLTDTYALLKVLYQKPLAGRLGLIVNGASGGEQALQVAGHLDAISSRFLGRGVPMWGYVPADMAVGRAVRAQRALLGYGPDSAAAGGVRELAGTVLRLLKTSRNGSD